MCRDCGKSFMITTNSIASGTHKDLYTWQKYIDCMMNIFTTFVLTTSKTVRNKDIPNREPVPLVA